MKKADDYKKIMEEFAPLLKEATNEQKILVKGILMGAVATNKAKEQKVG